METAELQDKIFAFVEAAKGKKKLKEKDIINGINAETGIDNGCSQKSHERNDRCRKTYVFLWRWCKLC